MMLNKQIVQPNYAQCNLTYRGLIVSNPILGIEQDNIMNRKPPELHLVDGTTPRKGRSILLPETIKKRIPKADWLDNPDAWDKDVFITETSEFLYTVYGIGNDQDKHVLAMLAGYMDTYISCSKAIAKSGIVTKFNNGATIGPNPYLTIKNKTQVIIVQLMNELGLTPRGRLCAGKTESNSPMSIFMQGPLSVDLSS